jgi:hypothetical protein
VVSNQLDFPPQRHSTETAHWTDIVAAVALDAPPRFTLMELWPPSPPPPEPSYSTIAHRYKTKLSNLTGLPSLAEETISTHLALRSITALKDTICFSPNFSQGPLDFETSAHTIESLERRCLSIIQSPLLEPYSPSPIHAIYSLFGRASLIHIMVFMRESARRLPFARILSNRIRDCLGSVDLSVFQIQYPELLMWVLVMGGLGGAGTENQMWFAGLLARAARAVGVVGVSDVEMVCSEWLWTRLYMDEVTEGFWADFEVAQGMESAAEEGEGDWKGMEVDEGSLGHRFSA